MQFSGGGRDLAAHVGQDGTTDNWRNSLAPRTPPATGRLNAADVVPAVSTVPPTAPTAAGPVVATAAANRLTLLMKRPFSQLISIR
jgi:hypothetical protein